MARRRGLSLVEWHHHTARWAPLFPAWSHDCTHTVCYTPFYWLPLWGSWRAAISQSEIATSQSEIVTSQSEIVTSQSEIAISQSAGGDAPSEMPTETAASTLAPHTYRLFDLGGSGFKTCILAASEAAEACALTNLGTCPPSMHPHHWIRSRVSTLDDELRSGVWFGFSLAGLVKLGGSHTLQKSLIHHSTTIVSLLNLTQAARAVGLSDGIAHLTGTLACTGHALRHARGRVVNLAIGTGIACARTLSTGEAVDCDFLSWRCPALHPTKPVMHFLVPTAVFKAGSTSSLDHYRTFARNWKVALHWWLTSGWPFDNASRPEAVYLTGWPRELPLFVDSIEALAKDLAGVVRIGFGPPLAQVRGLLTELTGRPAACNTSELI